MAVEDVIKLVKEVATEVIPDNIAFTDVKVESSNVVLYTPNVEIFSENNEVIRTLAQKVRKRIKSRPIQALESQSFRQSRNY